MAFNFKIKAKEFKLAKKTLPIRVGNLAKTHFVRSFADQGFTDENLEPWAARKSKNKSDRRNSSRRAILVKTGHLRRSIRVGRASFSRIEVGSYGIPYAKPHNQGLSPQTKRQFIGHSAQLSAEIRRTIQTEMKKILK